MRRESRCWPAAPRSRAGGADANASARAWVFARQLEDSDRLDGLRQAARVRAGPGAAGLGPPGRAQDQAGGDPPPRQPARAADRLAVRQPGRSGRLGVEQVRDDGASLDAGRGPVRRGRLGIRGAGDEHARALLSQRAGAGRGSSATGRSPRRARPSRDATCARPSRWRGAAARSSGGLLRHISTADTARDLDYLRRLVGDRQLTYLGLSYGTFIGQTYANMFPRRVRAMILDGVVDPVAVHEGHARRASPTAWRHRPSVRAVPGAV